MTDNFDASSAAASPIDDGADEQRRRFLGLAGGVALLSVTSVDAFASAEDRPRAGAGEGPSSSDDAFRERAFKIRVAAAQANRDAPVLPHPTNGDEERYPNHIGSDTRGLPHDARGEVDPAAFKASLKAYASGDPALFEAIPLGGTRKQLNPIGTLAVSLEGLNPAQFAVPPAPALESPTRAADIVELYWQSLLRDVPFTAFTDNTDNKDILAAVDELNKLTGFNGPRAAGKVTPHTLFRGTALYLDKSDPTGRTGRYVVPPGTLEGPYISQFALRDAPHGAQHIPARIRTVTLESTFLTDYDEWLTVQNGKFSGKTPKFDPTLRFIATGRDLAEYVHNNSATFWAAALLLGTPADKTNPSYGGFGTPLAPSNPYLKSKTQVGASNTFALPYIQGLLPYTASRAIRVAYWQKFFIHRTLRPEAYAGLIHHRLANKTDYPIHADVLNSQALARSVAKYGTHLLSHVYPEGAPIHSSYPGGASQIAAASVTILKAFYDENAIVPNPVQPDPKDPTRLTPYEGPPLTIGGELNKLAWNYGIGRDWAGIHFRSDFSSSLALGEELAISILRDERLTFREPFEGFSFTRFDGSKVTV
ncbi:twin-arginine translocation pathway signal protein [Bradyrhizobium sp. DN5]|uniref:twin-arginine translocation pathway signal protein n=1 Tax=Bradyrhizobium sp. DN5 TaxID=3056950 RepID=UPI003525346B